MRRVTRVLVVALFGLLVVLPAAPVATAAVAQHAPSAVSVGLAQPGATPTPSAPSIPKLNPQQAPNKSKQKLVIGLFSAVLLVIVVLGRRTRNKARKKAAGAISS